MYVNKEFDIGIRTRFPWELEIPQSQLEVTLPQNVDVALYLNLVHSTLALATAFPVSSF